jgi:hypothetical protein
MAGQCGADGTALFSEDEETETDNVEIKPKD